MRLPLLGLSLSLGRALGLGLILAALSWPATAEEENGQWTEAGFATIDITPTYAVPLGGYAERKGKRFTSRHDPIHARAAVFRHCEADRALALVSLDLVGVSRRMREVLLHRLADLELDDLVLTATHTHTGAGALTSVPLWHVAMGDFDPALFVRTAARIEAAVRRAHADLARVRISATRVPTAGLVRNRATPSGPLDESLGVLRIDAVDGTPRGVILHFASHPTILGPDVRALSAGWPGVLCRLVEDALPGARALFLQGAMGDVAPIAAGEAPFVRSTAYGRSLAGIAVEAHAALAPGPGTDGLEIGGTYDAWGWTVAGRLLGDREASALAPSRPWPLATSTFRLGPISFRTVPGEPVTAVGRALGQSDDHWVVACAQDHLGYFVDADLFRRGDAYEAELSLFGPDVSFRRPLDVAPSTTPTPRDPIHLVPPSLPPGASPRDPSGYGLGLAHGLTLRPEVRELLRAAETQIVDEVMGHGGGLILLPIAKRGGVKSRDLVIPALVRAARRCQQHIPTEYLEEMQGLAQGAAVPYDAILLENVFLTLAEQPDPTALLRLPAHCTNVVATGDATSIGQLLHASTLDWGMRDVLKARTVSLVMEPATGHPFVSITWPGMVGTLRAMGAQGIAVTEESCAAKNDTHLHGIPVNMLLRQVVQHASGLDEAVRWIRAGPGTCGYKITVSDGRALDARVVEVTATRSGVRAPKAGLLYGCDPAADCLDGPCDPSIPRNDGSSARRYPAVRRHLEPLASRLRHTDLQGALGLTDGGVLNDDTLLACVFEPQLGHFRVALRDDVDPEAGTLTWRSYSLPDLLTDDARARSGPPWPVREAGTVETKVKLEDFGGIRVEEVSFPSPVTSGVAVNDRVTAELYTPKNPLGAVVQLPHWKEARGAAGQRLIALAFARQGIAVLLLPLPYQYGRAPAGLGSGEGTLSADLARTREAALQGAADAARASLWLETLGYEPRRQAVLGVSLGGHVASLAFGAYPDRFGAGVFLLAAAGVGRAILEENGVTDGIRRRLLELGVTPGEASGMLRDIDPVRFALPRLADRVLLIAGTQDRVASRERVEALAQAWGGARIQWFEGDHYEMLRHAPQALAMVVAHLRERFGPR